MELIVRRDPQKLIEIFSDSRIGYIFNGVAHMLGHYYWIVYINIARAHYKSVEPTGESENSRVPSLRKAGLRGRGRERQWSIKLKKGELSIISQRRPRDLYLMRAANKSSSDNE